MVGLETGTARSPAGTTMWKRVLLVLLYTVIILTPASLAALLALPPSVTPTYRIGRSFALSAFMIMILQPVLAGRFKWIERQFGLDVVMLTHKRMDLVATSLLVSHPLLLAFGGYGIGLLYALVQPWYIWVARTTLGTLLVAVTISVYRVSAHLTFERWRIVHNILGPALFALAFTHSWFAGGDLRAGPLRWLWPCLLATALAVFTYHRFLQPWRLSRQPYRVVGVHQETKDVWTVTLAPPGGQKLFDYLPGQFQFITFQRGRGLPVEEHHWTISSSPVERATVSSTIKASGDFTATIAQTQPGDSATVHAPFGRFSYLVHPQERRFVFIAGGIGITPMMSMLRHMRDTRKTLEVLLIYANRGESDIVFRQELAEVEAGGFPSLRVVHVLSRPGESWAGETGRLDTARIQRLCEGHLEDSAFYVCGPKGLLQSVRTSLRGLGVARNRIHFEIFSFPN